jgi:afadin
MAYKHVDENLHREGFRIQLAEESDLNLVFLLPEDGYTCENLRGIPQQLFDLIEPINRTGVCRLFTNSYSLGLWTEFLQLSNVYKDKSNCSFIVFSMFRMKIVKIKQKRLY